ncbi:hypothetical protein SAMN05421841_1783 [Chryseobacterium wanjuense]|uniref:Uncharacterized protein n=1 Tax=Chryseobacterium wanjuense TaxID=356305 RepID=A0A1I0QAW7_9FLAO|nr:hypothetical protein [Chryseobacterium wanjuense]SEW24137.1 hypothetical protein SAMN05421841_1783 [Chryseobacterium wanjuense]
MEITGYIDFIKEQFKEVATANNMIFENRNAGIVALKNQFLEIYFSTEKYDDGMNAYFRNVKKGTYYSLYQSIIKKLGNPDFLTEDEITKSIEFNDDNKSLIFNVAIFVKNHCQDLLNGDFNSLK